MDKTSHNKQLDKIITVFKPILDTFLANLSEEIKQPNTKIDDRFKEPIPEICPECAGYAQFHIIPEIMDMEHFWAIKVRFTVRCEKPGCLMHILNDPYFYGIYAFYNNNPRTQYNADDIFGKVVEYVVKLTELAKKNNVKLPEYG